MYTKDRAYMLSKSFLMNDFLESFLVMFGKNKYTNLRRHWTIFFVTKQILKMTVLSTMAIKLW